MRGTKNRKTHTIPLKHHDKLLLECDWYGSYWLAGGLQVEHERTKKEMIDAQARRARDRHRPRSGASQGTADTAPAADPPAPAEVAMPEADAAAATPLIGYADDAEDEPGLHADMSGDAITTAQLSRSRHLHEFN